MNGCISVIALVLSLTKLFIYCRNFTQTKNCKKFMIKNQRLNLVKSLIDNIFRLPEVLNAGLIAGDNPSITKFNKLFYEELETLIKRDMIEDEQVRIMGCYFSNYLTNTWIVFASGPNLNKYYIFVLKCLKTFYENILGIFDYAESIFN